MAVTKLSLYDQIKGIAAGGTSAAGDMFVVSDTSGTIIKAANISYNSGTATLTTTTFSGALTGNVTGNVSGSSGSCTGTAALATSVTAVATTSSSVFYPLVADVATGSAGTFTTSAKLSFQPSSGQLSATLFSGPLTGNVTGNCSGTAATVTGAAQSSITSVGTLTGVTTSGTYGRSTAGIGYLNGGYAGAESEAKSGPIYCISPSYAPTATALSTMYGIGYTVGNGGAITGQGSAYAGWGFYVAVGGVSQAFIGPNSYFAGTVTAGTFSGAGTSLSGTANSLAAGALVTTTIPSDSADYHPMFSTVASGSATIGSINAALTFRPSTGRLSSTILSGSPRLTTATLTLSNGANQNVTPTADFMEILGPTGAFSIGGFSGGDPGRIITVYNFTAQTLTINYADAGSSAANRLVMTPQANVTIGAYWGSATFMYYNSVPSSYSYWIMIAHT